MTAVELMRLEAEMAFADFVAALDGVEEEHAWAVLKPAGEEYLHTDGSIHGLVLHVATCKIMYGSVAFRNSDIRWREVADQVAAFEPDWAAAKDYLTKSHEYWMSTWAELADKDLELEVRHFRGKKWPVWKILRMMTYHDAYHGGQIPVLRYALTQSKVHPPSVAEDLRNCCRDLPDW